jgi:hypothetical protein
MNESCSSPKFVASALSPVLLKICSAFNRTTAALVLSACVVAAAAQSDSPAFAKFKRDMMPKVGQKITVVGTWSDRTKQCCWLEFNHWGAYVYAGESGIARERELFAHFRNGQIVKLTGTLRYHAGPVAPKDEVQHVQLAPEHFFFDAAEVEMSLWSRPAPKNPKKER